MYKKITFIILLILPFAFKIDFCAQIDELYTWNDFFSLIEQVNINPITFQGETSTNYQINVTQFILNNKETIIAKLNNLGYNISTSYGLILKVNGAMYSPSSGSGTLNFYFLESNTTYSYRSEQNFITNCTGIAFNYNNGNITNNGTVTPNTDTSFSTWGDFPNVYGLTSGRLKSYTNRMNFENRFNNFTPSDNVLSFTEDNLQIGYARIGNYYNNNNIIIELTNTDLLLSKILDKNTDTVQDINNSYIYNVFIDSIEEIKTSKKYVVNFIDSTNNKTIYKSNEFTIEIPNNNSIIQNASGEVVGSINNDKIINSIDNLNQNQQNFNNQFFNSSFSGDFETPTPDLNSPAEPFYQNIINHLVDGLKTTDVQTITIQLPAGDTITIRSDALSWHNDEIHNFLQLVWWVGFGYAFFKVVWFIYEKLSNADFMGVINELENDKDIF